MKLSHVVKKNESQKRVVDILTNNLGMSRLLTKKIRLYGILTVNDIHHRMIDPVFEGDNIYISYGEPLIAADIILSDRNKVKVLYCDEHILVVSKPSGIVTHPTSGHQTDTLTDLFSEVKLHPVSRLDRETSGIIVFARDPHSHYLLSLQHQNKSIIKEYISFVHGVYSPLKGTVTAPVKRKENSIMLRCVSPEGQTAVTHYCTIKKFENIDTSFVKFRLETGRTHQIRVHSLYTGHPIIGDGLYGALSHDNPSSQKSAYLDKIAGRQCLHASKISFLHPMTKKTLTIRAVIPDDMKNILKQMKKDDFINNTQ